MKFQDIFEKKINGIERRRRMERFYFKICIAICGAVKSKISEVSGYSYKTVHDKIKDDPEILKFFNDVSRVDTNPCIKFPTNVRNDNETIERYINLTPAQVRNKLIKEHIKRVSNTFWFKQLSRDNPQELKKVLDRIKNLYI